MPDEQVNIVIRARDMSARAFRDVRKHLRSIGSGVRTLIRNFTLLTAAIVGSVAVLAKAAMRGGEVLSVQRAFNRATGGEGVQSLSRLRDATRGLISDYELMTGFTKALTLGAVDNAEQFGTLAQTAITLGRAMGIDAAYALESLNTGIARQSRLFLDNIGIVMSVGSANKRYADTIGKTVAQLTDAEKREAFRTEALRQAAVAVERLGGLTENAGDAANRFWQNLKNLKDELMIIATSPLVEKFFNMLSDFVNRIAQIFQEGEGEKLKALFHNLGVIAANAFSVGFMSVYRELPGVGFQGFFERQINRGLQNMRDAAAEIAYMAEIATPPQMPGGGAGMGRGGFAPSGIRARMAGRPPVVGFGFLTPGILGRGAEQARELSLRQRMITYQRDYLARLEDERRAKDLATQQTEHMAMTVIHAFGAIAQSGSNMISSLIGGATSILAAIPGVGPIAQAGILTGGSILSRLFGSGPTPVLIDDYSPRALQKQMDIVQPIHLTNIIKGIGGVELARTERELLRRSRRDASFRIYPGSLG
jgi:hypothetical protein